MKDLRAHQQCDRCRKWVPLEEWYAHVLSERALSVISPSSEPDTYEVWGRELAEEGS